MRLLLAGYRGSPSSGGQGIYARQLVRALLDEGVRVECVFGPPYPETEDIARLHRLESLDLFATRNALLALRWRHWRSWADMSEWLAHNTGAFGEPYAFGRRFADFLAKRDNQYDVVFDNQTFAWGMLATLKTPVALTGVIHHPISVDKDIAVAQASGRVARAFKRRWYGFVGMQAQAARRYDGLLAVSAAARDDAARAFGLNADAIRVAWNGVDHTLFKPQPKSAPRADETVFAVASSQSPIKGLDVLAAAFAKVAVQRPQARLRLAGASNPEGPGGKILAKLTQCGRVVYEGRMTAYDLARAYADADVVASASRYEGFGLPLAEAMACSAAVVASSGGAQGEVLGGTGVLVPPGDANALADAIIGLLADPARRARLGAKAQARAQEHFSWRTHARAVIALSEDAIRRRQQA